MKPTNDSQDLPLDDLFFSELVGTDTNFSTDNGHSNDSAIESGDGEVSEQRSQIPLYKKGSVKSALIFGLSALPIGGLGYVMFGGNNGQKNPTVAASPSPEPTAAPKAEFAPDPRFATVQNKLAMQDQTRAIEDAAKAQEAERLAKAAADAKTAATPQPQATPVAVAPAVTPASSTPRTNVEPPAARNIPPIAPVTEPVPVAPAITPPVALVPEKPQPVAKQPQAVVVKPQEKVVKPQIAAFKPQPVVTKPQPATLPSAVPTVQPTWQEATDNAVGVFGEKTASKTVLQPTQPQVTTQPVLQPTQPQVTAQPALQPVQPATIARPIERVTAGQSNLQPIVRTGLQVDRQPIVPQIPTQVQQLIQPQSSIKNAAANYIASTSNKIYTESLSQPLTEPDFQQVVRAVAAEDKLGGKQDKSTLLAQAVVIPGQNRTVSLISPMQLLPGEAGQEILLQLDRGFADTNGGVPIPDGTRIIATVTVASNGLMRIAGATAIINGETVPIDASSLVLNGTDNNPVIAQYRQFDQGEIGRRDLQTFLAGAASGLGKILTQPNTNVQVSTAGTAVVSSTSNPNIIGGILDGGATPILEAWAKRNETEIRRLEGASRLWYLPLGYKMTIVAVKPFVVR
jgi:hypothetical protein